MSGESKDWHEEEVVGCGRWQWRCVTAAAAAPRAEIIEQIIVKVNGDIITKTEFEQRQVLALRARKIDVRPAIRGAEEGGRGDHAPADRGCGRRAHPPAARAGTLGYKLSDEQFNQVVSQIRKDNKLETEEAFLAALKQEGMTMADLRRSLEKQMIISRVQGQEVMQKVGITEEEALAVSRRAPRRVHEAGLRHAARNSAERPGIGRRRQRRRRPGHARARRGDPRARQGRGGVREDRGRVVGCSVEGERRPDRPADDDRAGAGAAEAVERHEARRHQRAAADAEGLPAAEARDHDAGGGAAARTGARPDRRKAVRGEARRGDPEVPGQDAQGSHHRVEERRAPEGVRGGPGGRRDGDAPS